MSSLALIGLGSNLGDRRAYLDRALAELRGLLLTVANLPAAASPDGTATYEVEGDYTLPK